jgi:hypothetical protein
VLPALAVLVVLRTEHFEDCYSQAWHASERPHAGKQASLSAA